MNELFELIVFFQKTKLFSPNSFKLAMQKIGFDENKFDLFTKQVIVIEEIHDLIIKHSNCDAKFLLTHTKLHKETLDLYIKVLEVVTPGIIKYKHIVNHDRRTLLMRASQTFTVNSLLQQHKTKKEIGKTLDVSVDEVDELTNTLPVISNMDKQIQILKEENLIREFFAVKPYTTIRDAAKQLQIPGVQIRTIVETLRHQGEDIKFNNVPAILEKEKLYSTIIQKKVENPAYTNKELAMSLGIPPKQVTLALNDSVKTFQREKSQNVSFYFNNMLKDLNELIEYTWTRAKVSENTSSRWAELNLMAQEKIIRIVGLNAPEKHEVSGGLTLSKGERDKVIEGYEATDVTDIDFELVEVTGTD